MKQDAAVIETATGVGAVFEAEGLKKEYDDGRVQALRGVDFRITEGEFVAIVGQSGSGKSTLLQLLGALDSPSDGKLSYRGMELSRMRDLAGYRAREIGFVFQAFHLLPTFTALENVQMPMFETHHGAGERRERELELLRAVGLQARVNHLPAKLSGGERQRVAIARSLANSPSVLLADEPTGNLDSENAVQILELLTSIHAERKMTMILVTHDHSVARRASRAIQIRDGHIVYDGPPADIPIGSFS
jgi:putative ABC transport system ATP-binding protein